MIKAVLVGVEHYPDAGASWSLDGPANDVLRVLTYLHNRGMPREAIRCFVNVLPHKSAVLDQIRASAAEVDVPTEASLNRLFDDVLPQSATDSLLLYWSGHAFMEKDGQRRLFTSDARPDSKKNINLSHLLDALDSTSYRRIRQVDAIIDACANYVAATTVGITDRSFAVGERSAGGEQRILCAASAGEYARNLSAEQTGLFTKELMQLVELAPPATGTLFDFKVLVPVLRERFAALRREGKARHVPSLIWSRADGVTETASLPSVDDGDLFLTRLGVFKGSFSFLGCTAVYPISRTLEVEAQIRRLRKARLLLQHETFPRRYVLTPDARRLAQERLEVLGEVKATRDKHARFYAELTGTHELSLRHPARRGSMDLLEQELDNLREALAWCRTQPELIECGLGMAASLFWFWNLTARFDEGSKWVRDLLEADSAQLGKGEKGVGGRYTAGAHYAAGALAFMVGEYEKARDLLERSKQFWSAEPSSDKERNLRLAYTLVVLGRAKENVTEAIAEAQSAVKLFVALHDRWGQALALNDRGYGQARALRWKDARCSFNKSLSLWRDLGDTWGMSLTLNNLGMVQLREGQPQSARKSHEEALQFQLEEGDMWGTAESLKLLGEVALETEDFAEAKECFHTSLNRLEKNGRRQNQLDCLLGLVSLEAMAEPRNDSAVRATRLLATWECETEKGDLILPPHHTATANALKQRLKNSLHDRFSTEWEAGKNMLLKDALCTVLKHWTPPSRFSEAG